MALESIELSRMYLMLPVLVRWYQFCTCIWSLCQEPKAHVYTSYTVDTPYTYIELVYECCCSGTYYAGVTSKHTKWYLGVFSDGAVLHWSTPPPPLLLGICIFTLVWVGFFSKFYIEPFTPSSDLFPLVICGL